MTRPADVERPVLLAALFMGLCPLCWGQLPTPPPILPVPPPILRLAASPKPVRVNETLTYTMTIGNWPSAGIQDLALTFSIPTDTVYLAMSTSQGTCAYDSTERKVDCTVSTLAAGASAIVSVQVRPEVAGLTIAGTAYLTAVIAGRSYQLQQTDWVLVRAISTSFYTVTPCRLYDSRQATPLQANQERTLQVGAPLAPCGVDQRADAVSINVTVTGATAAGDLILYPWNTPRPQASTISFRPGQTRANNAVAVIGEVWTLSLYPDLPPGSTVHVIIDVNGYFQ